MEIKIRNVDVVAVKKIDQLAKAQKMSRNEFLKVYLERLSQYDLYQKESERFKDAAKEIAEALAQSQIELEKMKVMFLLMMGVDEKELDEFINEFILKEGANISAHHEGDC